jgi:hypothetical protein
MDTLNERAILVIMAVSAIIFILDVICMGIIYNFIPNTIVSIVGTLIALICGLSLIIGFILFSQIPERYDNDGDNEVKSELKDISFSSAEIRKFINEHRKDIKLLDDNK